MVPISSSLLSDPQRNKSVRFDEKVRVVLLLVAEGHQPSNERNNENYAASDESDNEADATVMRSVLSTSNIERRTMLERLPMDLFDLSSTYPPERSSSKDNLTYPYSRELLFPVGLLSMPEPTGTRGCIDIINSALECVESMETDKIND